MATLQNRIERLEATEKAKQQTWIDNYVRRLHDEWDRLAREDTDFARDSTELEEKMTAIERAGPDPPTDWIEFQRANDAIPADAEPWLLRRLWALSQDAALDAEWRRLHGQVIASASDDFKALRKEFFGDDWLSPEYI
jgi:hypothetical protein